jgi:hypothetical protein
LPVGNAASFRSASTLDTDTLSRIVSSTSTVQRGTYSLKRTITFISELTSKQNELSVFAQPLRHPSDSLLIWNKTKAHETAQQ